MADVQLRLWMGLRADRLPDQLVFSVIWLFLLKTNQPVLPPTGSVSFRRDSAGPFVLKSRRRMTWLGLQSQTAVPDLSRLAGAWLKMKSWLV